VPASLLDNLVYLTMHTSFCTEDDGESGCVAEPRNSSERRACVCVCVCVCEDECQNGGGAMEQSEDSGSLMGGEADSIDSSGWSDAVGITDIEQISAELANRGPPQSDVKLR
jgi:hypothetical protein